MDSDTLKRLRERYKDNPDVQALLQELTELEIKLQNADILAMTVDVSIQRGLDPRSLIGDARLNYGQPWEFKYATKKQLLRYKNGLEEIRRKFPED